MPEFGVVLTGVFTMVLLLVPGFIFEKKRRVPADFTDGLSFFTLYIAQPAMIINAFLRSFDRDILLNLGIEMLLGIVAYAVSFIIVCLCFRKSDASVKGVLKFMTAFCNVGFMGLPVLKSVFGDQGDLAVLYGTGIVVCHNVLTWTVGVKMLAPKGQKGGAKKALLNPGVLACVAGAILFAFSANEVMPQFLLDVCSLTAGTVTPLAMFTVGAHLSHFDFRGLFRRPQLLIAVGMRLLVLPGIIFLCFYALRLTNIIPLDDVMLVTVPFLQMCMPSASITSMMAQRYGGDVAFAGAGVSIATLLSLFTIPLMSLLLKLL